jgi:hypothetical protein
MSRIGEGVELGRTLLEPLLRKGWELHGVDEPITAFAGGRRLFILRHPTIAGGLEIKAEGATLGDVACELMQNAAPWTPWERNES